MRSSLGLLARTVRVPRRQAFNGLRSGRLTCNDARHYSQVSAAELQFGQPLHETHPHLLQAGELTPGITAIEYAERRANLAKSLPIGSVAIFAAADVKFRSGVVFYPFHQDADFFYLTGFNEPEAVAVIEKTGPGPEHIFHLYVRPKDAKVERWDGSRSGVQAAQDVFNADEAGDINNVQETLRSLVGSASEVYTDIARNGKATSTFSQFFGLGRNTPQGFAKIVQSKTIHPARPLLNELRVHKSPAEIRNLRRAGQASARAFTNAMQRAWTGESALEAFMEYKFRELGCETSAYVPVVAGGLNATMIHYVRNDDVLQNGQLVTVDAGGEYGGYVADITRTWPVNGKFTQPQRDMYDMILGVQRTCVSLCRASAGLSLDQLHQIADSQLQDGLRRLGFDVNSDAMASLFPHHLGHYIGLAVHDSPGYSRTGKLQAGQCITIEPGIYVDEQERWPKHFRGMGIRIEDSVCIEEDAPLILTTEAVKEVVDIEACRRR